MKLFITDHSAALALVLCARGSAQKLLAPFSRQRVFLLKDSGFIRSSRVTDASWLRLVPSLLHEHLTGYKLTTQANVAYGTLCLFICLEGQCGLMYFY